MLTIFTIPKPFQGQNKVSQINAIKSWLKVIPDCEIILFGDEIGVSDVAKKYNMLQISDILKNEYGTPLLSDVFEKAQKLASYNLLCYINADIILTKSFINSLNEIYFDRYLLSGQRFNMDLSDLIDFNNENWETELIYALKHQGPLLLNGGMDYFVFPKGTIKSIPQFAVGRAGWDNWLVYYIRKQKLPMIDASCTINVIHQNHNYNHVPNKIGDKYLGAESDRNIQLAGNYKIYLWNLEDSDFILSKDGLKRRPINIREVYRRTILVLPSFFHPILEYLFGIQHKLRYRTKSDDD